jgi:hypothetical protein
VPSGQNSRRLAGPLLHAALGHLIAQNSPVFTAKLAADVRSRYSRLPAANQKSLEEDLKDANL